MVPVVGERSATHRIFVPGAYAALFRPQMGIAAGFHTTDPRLRGRRTKSPHSSSPRNKIQNTLCADRGPHALLADFPLRNNGGRGRRFRKFPGGRGRQRSAAFWGQNPALRWKSPSVRGAVAFFRNATGKNYADPWAWIGLLEKGPARLKTFHFRSYRPCRKKSGRGKTRKRRMQGLFRHFVEETRL